MKKNHFITFVTLILLEVILCISFFYIYSGWLQKSFIENLDNYSKELGIHFKAGKFFISPTEEDETVELINKRLGWIQSNYRANPSLKFLIFRNITTNEIIFSNARNENLESVIREYTRQWRDNLFWKNNFFIFNIGNYNLISILIEIDDDVRPIGNLELIYDYSTVQVEIEKLKTVLIYFASSIAILLFLTFLIVSLLLKKKNIENKNHSFIPSLKKNKEESERGDELNNKDIGINPNVKTLRLGKTSKTIKRSNAIQGFEEELNIKDDVNSKSEQNNENNKENNFLKNTKNKKRNYIHKVTF